MLLQLARIFFDVITPVFGLVLAGYLLGKPLQLEARTLSRYAYYLLVPSFMFSVLSTAELEASLLYRMMGFILLVQLLVTLLGFIVARLMGHRGKMVGAYMLLAVFANVGNFGLPIIEFHLGKAAILPATVYFLIIVVVSFVIGVSAANYTTGGSLKAILEVFKTPALIGALIGILVNITNIPVPIMFQRMTSLLGGAMVPTMLVTLGVQLTNTKRIAIDRDIIAATAVRLVGGAGLALLLVGFFGLNGLERGAGIFQAAMPAAVLCTIIAMEYDLVPEFVTKTVLFSTIASIFTLTLLLAIV